MIGKQHVNNNNKVKKLRRKIKNLKSKKNFPKKNNMIRRMTAKNRKNNNTQVSKGPVLSP